MYFEEKPMVPLTNNEKALYANEKQCDMCEIEFRIDKKKVRTTKINVKLGIIVILQVNIMVLLIVYAI